MGKSSVVWDRIATYHWSSKSITVNYNKRKIIHCVDTKEEVSSYEKYLHTEHWKKIKEKFLYYKPNRLCYACKSIEDLELHHTDYSFLGKELTVENGKEVFHGIISLCKRCHSRWHGDFRLAKRVKRERKVKKIKEIRYILRKGEKNEGKYS